MPRGLTGNAVRFTESISFLTRDRLWAGGNPSWGAHYRAVKFLLKPFDAYDISTGGSGYPWSQNVYEYPTSQLSGNGTLDVGTAEAIYNMYNHFKWCRCYRVRMRIEWMWSTQHQDDTGTDDNDIRLTLPNVSLYYFKAQRTVGPGRLSGSSQLGNMMNYNNTPVFVWPDQNRMDTGQMERPYSELFDVKGLKRMRFTRNSNVRWLAWRPISSIARSTSTWRVDQVARSWADVQLGNQPTYEVGFAPGGIAFYSDLEKLINGDGGLVTVRTWNSFKISFYFDYVFWGRT